MIKQTRLYNILVLFSFVLPSTSNHLMNTSRKKKYSSDSPFHGPILISSETRIKWSSKAILQRFVHDKSEAGSKRHRNHREIVRHNSPPSLLPRLVALFRLYFTNGAIIMTFKRRCADCTATGITFPNRLIYLALSWTNNNRRSIVKNYEGVMNLIKCPCTLPPSPPSPPIRDAFRFAPSNRQNYRLPFHRRILNSQ